MDRDPSNYYLKNETLPNQQEKPHQRNWPLYDASDEVSGYQNEPPSTNTNNMLPPNGGNQAHVPPPNYGMHMHNFFPPYSMNHHIPPSSNYGYPPPPQSSNPPMNYYNNHQDLLADMYSSSKMNSYPSPYPISTQPYTDQKALQQMYYQTQMRPQHDGVKANLCVRCMRPIEPREPPVMLGGQFAHAKCFVCEFCGISLRGIKYFVQNGKPCCENHVNQLKMMNAHIPPMDPNTAPPQEEIPPLPDSAYQGMELTISVQPAVYQIANYNVHPAPKVALESTLPVSLSITVALVETNLNLELKEGFQAGHIRTLRAGGNCIHFTGLKLSKMGKIKGELRQKNIKQMDRFHIRFIIGPKTWDSSPFRLVSSCTQLPKDIRETVRPPKRPHSSPSSGNPGSPDSADDAVPERKEKARKEDNSSSD